MLFGNYGHDRRDDESKHQYACEIVLTGMLYFESESDSDATAFITTLENKEDMRALISMGNDELVQVSEVEMTLLNNEENNTSD